MGKYRTGDYVDFEWSYFEKGKKVKKFGRISETFGKGTSHVDIREIDKKTGEQKGLFDVKYENIISKGRRKK